MKIVIDIPKEFEEHFNSDRFEDSLARIASDIESFGFQLAGRYEQETITMLRKAIKNSTPLPEHHGRLIDADTFQKYCFNKNFDKRLSDGGLAIINFFLGLQPTIIEGSESK